MKYIKANIIEEQYTSIQLKRISNEPILQYGKDLNGKSVYGINLVDTSYFLSQQDSRILAEEVTYADIKDVLANSFMMNEYNKIVERKIAERYSIGRELKMRDMPIDDPQRIEYETFKASIKAMVNNQKREVGLIQ